MNIVLVAGGLGTRFKELSVFPKILLPTAQNDSILAESIKKFNKENNFYLVINSKFYDMVNNYVNVNHIKEQLDINYFQIISTNVSNGSLSTLADIQKILPDNDVLFIWSDIILPNDIDIDTICQQCIHYDGIIFTSSDNNYRYNFDGLDIQQDLSYSGNVPGIYYFKKLPNFKNYYTMMLADHIYNYDLVDMLQYQLNYKIFLYAKKPINGIIEYKDLDTYKNIIKQHHVNLCQTRFFNNIDIDESENKVIKSAINPDYYHIIQDEAKWYETVIDLIGEDSGIIPKIFNLNPDEHKIEMEYLKEYIPLHTFNDNASEDDMYKAYEGIQNNLNIFEQYTKDINFEDFVKDLEKELKTKVIDRCDKISYMLINYDKQYLTSLLDKVMDTILKTYKETDNIKYTLCHGDLNGSNVMVNKNKPDDVKFIDPRGYFGFTKMYGWPVYEYAKLLYGLMGYDDFNLNPQIYLTDIPKNHKYINNIEYLNKDIYKLVVGIIYVALAGYISQDIMKANIAYEYGIKLIENYYKKYNELINNY